MTTTTTTTLTPTTIVQIYDIDIHTGEWVRQSSDTWLAICEANIEDASALADAADCLRKHGYAVLDLGAGGCCGFAIVTN